LILALSFSLILTGCNSTGYDDPEEVVQSFLDAYAKAAEGEEVDEHEYCLGIAKGDFLDVCESYLLEAKENGPFYSWIFTINLSNIRDLSEIERIGYELEEYDDVCELYVEWKEDAIWEEGDTIQFDKNYDVVYLVKEDGNYFIVSFG